MPPSEQIGTYMPVVAVVFVARRGDLDQRAGLAAADALGLARDADGAAADADLDKIRARLGQEHEAVAIDHVARADLDTVAVALANEANASSPASQV